MLLVDMASNQIYELNSTGSKLWTLLSSGKDIDEAARAILDEFDVSPERLASEAAQLVEALTAAGLAVDAKGSGARR